MCWGFAPLLRCLKTRLVPSSCKALPVIHSWGGSSENYYHQTQQWCCHISVDSSTSSEFAKARHPLILLRIVSAGTTSEWSQRDNYPLPYTTSKPWAEFHLVLHWQHFTFTCRHLSRHCATYKAGENRILQIWTGVRVICSHTHFTCPIASKSCMLVPKRKMGVLTEYYHWKKSLLCSTSKPFWCCPFSLRFR